MSFDFKPAAPPPPPITSKYAKLPVFATKLVVVVGYDDTKRSQYKRDGSDEFTPQTRAKVIPIQAGSHTNKKTGEETVFEAGEVYDIFIDQVYVRQQIRDLGKPVLGRLLMPDKGWVLAEPTEADEALAHEVLKDVDLELPEIVSEKSLATTAPSKAKADDPLWA